MCRDLPGEGLQRRQRSQPDGSERGNGVACDRGSVMEIKQLPAVVKAAIRKATRAAAKEIASVVKSKAPSETGQLRAAVKVRALSRSRKWIGAVVTVQVPYGS